MRQQCIYHLYKGYLLQSAATRSITSFFLLSKSVIVRYIVRDEKVVQLITFKIKDINENASCRVCVVELEGKEKLITSCNNVAEEGMVIYTNSPKVRRMRQ